MPTSDRYDLLKRNTAEIVTGSDLKRLKRDGIRGYIGVEPSGLFHVGWTLWVEKVKDLIDAGVQMTFLEATWHAWINDKLGGKIGDIKACAAYLRHCLAALGVAVGNLEFVDAEELISDPDYWALLLKVAKHLTLARVKRAMTIMGRRTRDADTDFSKLIYPTMQVSDIFYLDLDVCLGGTDQRRAHVLAREVSRKLGFKTPVGIHTPLLMSLGGLGRMDVERPSQMDVIEGKMSKSKPETCVYIHDSEDEIRRKLVNAYCPPKMVDYNPILEFNRHLLFSEEDFALRIDRPTKFGGASHVKTFRELVKGYLRGDIHPLDLKNATATALSEKLAPVRRYFAAHSEATELHEKMRKLTVSR
jgi:tyrosyl-tRNA synthetase